MMSRRLGILRRLVLSFLLVLVVPLAVSIGTLAVALEVFVPRAEASYVGRIQRSLETDYLPEAIGKLRLGEIQSLLALGKSDEITRIVREVLPTLAEGGDSAEILREDGSVLFSIGGSGTRIGAIASTREVALSAGRRATVVRLPPLPGLGFRVIPGFSFVDTRTARYIWPLAPDAEGPVYGSYTFAVPGSARAVETVSGSYTVVAVGAGIVAFAILVIVLSLRLSRIILVPLGRLSAAAESIAAGNLDSPILVDGKDEFGTLAAAFEQMRVRLRESLLRLHRGDAERRRMVASVSHDLKTPLTSIRGYVEGLRDGVADNPEARERYFAVVLEKASQLESLIDGLSRISRLELGEEELDRQPASSRRLFGELFARAGRDAQGAGLRCTVEEPLADVPLRVDRAAMAQVVDNIVQNSLRHATGVRELRLCARVQAGMLEVCVADDGPGFVSSDLPRVFELFYRGDAARAQGGAGLGLFICRRLVEKHGGTVSAENDNGALVRIRLPIDTSS